jgi:hypothetical protein
LRKKIRHLVFSYLALLNAATLFICDEKTGLGQMIRYVGSAYTLLQYLCRVSWWILPAMKLYRRVQLCHTVRVYFYIVQASYSQPMVFSSQKHLLPMMCCGRFKERASVFFKPQL